MGNVTTSFTSDKAHFNENELQNIETICGVECYEKDGTAYLKLETVARGLGFTEIAASGNECIRWRTVKKYLENLGIAESCDGNLPDFIPENIFYRLAMKAKNETAEAFQAKVADEIIPSIRKHGGYIENQEELSPEEIVANALIVAKSIIAKREKELIESQKHEAELQAQLDTSKEWYSIKRVASLNGVSWKKFDWRKLKRIGEQMGYEVKKIFDANYGEVNTYHKAVWEVAYPQYEL